MELNPNHPVVNEAREQWHKFVAVLMLKFNKQSVEITEADVEALAKSDRQAVVLDMRGGRCVLRLVSMAEGERLAKQEGGLPH